jgi:hypothetical protein
MACSLDHSGELQRLVGEALGPYSSNEPVQPIDLQA